MPKSRSDIIANQVFVGCPWYRVRAKYERAINDLNKRYPLSLVIVGRDEDQDAKELLEIIKGKLESSTRAIFDATHGNANVSMEYGYAEAKDIERSIYLSSRKGSKKVSDEKPIISDLAGKKQNHYKQIATLKKLLMTMAKNHDYTKRFEKFLGRQRLTPGKKKRARALALKIIHTLDSKLAVRREDIVLGLLSSYKRGEVDQMIKRLNGYGLIQSVQGRYSTVSIT